MNTLSLTTAIGIGLLLGMVAERRKTDPDHAATAGLRTHTLAALGGAVAMGLGGAAFAVTLAFGGVLAALGYARTRASDAGLTSEFALLLTVLLGGMTTTLPALAASIGVIAAILLHAQATLHRFSRELMSDREVSDGLILLASALVILPLLPDRPLGPYAVFNPATVWKLVVLVMAISAVGHVALRLVGTRRGLAVSGFFAGYVSSTAATAGFGQRVAEQPALLSAAVGATMLANLASLSLFAPILLAVSPSLLTLTWPALTAAGLTLLAGGVIGLHRGSEEQPPPPNAETRMFRVGQAILFAAIITAVLFLSTALGAWLGPGGAMMAAFLTALAELQAAAASIANLFDSGVLDARQGRWAVVGLLGASGLAKSVVAWTSGGRRFGLRVLVGLAASVTAAAGATALS